MASTVRFFIPAMFKNMGFKSPRTISYISLKKSNISSGLSIMLKLVGASIGCPRPFIIFFRDSFLDGKALAFIDFSFLFASFSLANFLLKCFFRIRKERVFHLIVEHIFFILFFYSNIIL